MAKKSTKTKAMESTAPVVVKTAEQMFADELRTEFYVSFKRQTTLNDNDMSKLIVANATDQQMAPEWWFAKMQEAEKAKGIATPRVESTNAIVDMLSKDTELTDVSLESAKAGDLPPRAPSHIAFMMMRDHALQFNGDTRKAREWIVNSYADPGSKQSTGADGWGNILGDNERVDYFWDYADYGTGIVSWYAEKLVDCLPSGIAINKVRTTLKDKRDETVLLDGVAVNPTTMPSVQLKNAISQWDSRRSRLITAYRDAVSVIRQWHDIETRLGIKHDDDGKVSDIGRVAVDWAWLDESDHSSGLSPTKAIIVVRNILQDGERRGQWGGVQQTFTASQFNNLSVDMAITNAAKAGRGLDRVSLTDIASSKREKKQTTTAGAKAAKAKRAAEEAARITAKTFDLAIEKMFQWTENEDNWSALLAERNRYPQDKLKLMIYMTYKLVGRIDKKLITPDSEKIAKEVEAEITLARQKEQDAKALADAS